MSARKPRYRLLVAVAETDDGYEFLVACCACHRSLRRIANPATVDEILRAGRHRCKPPNSVAELIANARAGARRA